MVENNNRHLSVSRIAEATGRAALVVALALVACTPPAQRPTPPPAQPTRPASALDPYRSACAEAARQRKAGTSRDAYALSLDLINSVRFADLGAAEQHSMLWETGALGARLGDYTFAQRLLVRASEMPEAVLEDWRGRLYTDYRVGDRADSMHTLSVMTRRWPESLSTYKAPYLRDITAWTPRTGAEEAARFELGKALFDARWKGEDGLEPGWIWAPLVRDYVARGDSAAALAVLAHLNDPEQIAALRVDKRLEVLVRLDPAAFDVAAAARRYVEERRAAAEAAPKSLAAVVNLAGGYEEVGLYEQALAVTGAALARIAAVPSAAQAYDDADQQLNWLWDHRGRELQWLGRWHEAEEARRRAADLPEDGGANAGSVINLAGFYADLGRSGEALATLRRYDGPLSPYGYMQLHAAQLRAAVASGDAALERQSLDYLRDHQQDAIQTLQAALVRANQLGEAAALLITRLRDPNLRSDALSDVQVYRDPPAPQLREVARERWRKLLAREDVRAAINEVGRSERVPIPGGLW